MKELKRKSLKGKDRLFDMGDGLKVKVWVNRLPLPDGNLGFLCQAFSSEFKKPSEDVNAQAYTDTIHRQGIAETDIVSLITDRARELAIAYKATVETLATLEDVPEWTTEEGASDGDSN